MKLRNKNTGEIVELKLIQVNDKYLEDHEVNFLNGEKLTLKTLADSFNDVKEPLIKDEKIRKAVRAWADGNIIHQVEFEYAVETGSIFKDGICGVEIGFYDDLKLTNRETYTIDELCGEEEKQE